MLSAASCFMRHFGPARGFRVWSARLVWLLAFLLLLPQAFAAELPQLTGRVVDAAELLSPAEEAALSAKLEGFEKRSSDQIVVATVPSLGGEAIEPYANRLFRAWKLGQAGENNGVLLLVSRNDRKMRIEVGYGLEGTLTDLLSGQIIRNTLTPAFRAGDFSGGISKAVDDIITALEGNAAELEARFQRNQKEEGSGFPPEVVIFFLVWIGIFAVGFGGAILPPLLGRKLGPNRYRWLGMDFNYTRTSGSGSTGWSSGSGGGWSSGSSSGWSSGGSSRSSGGGFSGGGGSSGGGGASGSW